MADGEYRVGGTDPTHARSTWRAEVDAMFERMQTPAFARAVLIAFDEPLRVDISDHLRRSSVSVRRQEP